MRGSIHHDGAKRTALMSVGLLLPFLVLLAAISMKHVGARSKPATHAVWNVSNDNNPQQPCGPGGEPTTLSQVVSTAPYPVFMPDDQLASESSMAAVWQCGVMEIDLQFASGINLFENVNTFTDPASSWQRLAKDSPEDTSVGHVNGIPAAMIDPQKSTGGALGSITFVSQGTWLVVVGDGKLTIDDLTRVATSMKAITKG